MGLGGVLVAVRLGERHNQARLARFDDAALEAAIGRALALDTVRLDAIGAAARQWFVDNKRGFATRIQSAVDDLVRLLHGGASGMGDPGPGMDHPSAGRDHPGG